MIKKLLKIFLVLFTSYFLLAFIFTREGSYTFTFERTGLKDEIEGLLQSQEGRYGIFVKNLLTDETFSQREDEIFKTGSLYKLWVMAGVFENIKNSKINENDPLTANIQTLNKKFDLGGEEAEFQEGEINFSVKSAVEQMITISHNYAALALLDKVGSSEIEAFLAKYGFSSSKLGIPPQTSAKDLADFLEKLYLGEIIDQEYSQKMMDILARQTINDRLPKYLPQGTKVAHKTGDIGFFENDAGIVFSPKGDFIIVVLSETKDPASAGELIAKISKAVYDYFN